MVSDGEHYTTSIIALAGRRIDAPGTTPPRFSLSKVEEVRSRLEGAFAQLHAVALVCSAACGADLIGLEVAEQLGIRRRIVLPFASERFRKSSVVDRPGDWGRVFDRQIAAAVKSDDLVVLDLGGGDDQAYTAANGAIIQETLRLAGTAETAKPYRLAALLVWEGARRQASDATAAFGELARKAGFERITIPTS